MSFYADFHLVVNHSMASSFQSAGQFLDHYTIYSIQAVYTGSPVGTLSLASSNDGVTWDTITGTSTAVSAAGSTMFNVTITGYKWVRLEYVATSGTGTLNAFYVGKGS